MKLVTRKAVNPSLIENTSMNKVFIDGVHKLYEICANDGYVLHDSRADIEPDGITIFELDEMLAPGTISVRYDYDFTNKTQGTYNGADVTKYGAFELYTIASDLLLHSNISPSIKKTTAQTEG